MQSRLRGNNINHWLAASSLGLVSLTALAFLVAPSISASVWAVTTTTGNPNTPSVNTSVKGVIPDVLSVSLGDHTNMEFDVLAGDTGVFVSGETELSVTTNSPAGYQVFLTTIDGQPTLNNTNPDSSSSIGPINGSVTRVNFQSENYNTWGYALTKNAITDDTTYTALPSTGSAVLTVNAPARDVYNLSFGSILSGSLPSGTYSNTIIVSVVPRATTLNALTLDADPDSNDETANDALIDEEVHE